MLKKRLVQGIDADFNSVSFGGALLMGEILKCQPAWINLNRGMGHPRWAAVAAVRVCRLGFFTMRFFEGRQNFPASAPLQSSNSGISDRSMSASFFAVMTEIWRFRFFMDFFMRPLILKAHDTNIIDVDTSRRNSRQGAGAKQQTPSGKPDGVVTSQARSLVRPNPHAVERPVHEEERDHEEGQRQPVLQQRTLVASERNCQLHGQ
jgi:hypothetical protein